MVAPREDKEETNAHPGLESRPVFRREGEYWTVAFDGSLCRLKHTRGMQHLAALLARPGERIAALELTRLAPTRTRARARALDERRIDEASTPAPRDGEQARVNVTRQIRSVLTRIAEHHPVLARHLTTRIRTGFFCSYVPDSRLPIRWQF